MLIFTRNLDVQSIVRGAEILTSSRLNGRSTVELLSSVIVELLEGKMGSKDRALSLFLVGGNDTVTVRDQPKRINLDKTFSGVLTKAFKATGLQCQARKIFMLWPNLKTVTERFCHYVSPLLGSGGLSTLLQESITNAVNAYNSEINPKYKVRAYLLGLVKLAHHLTCITIKGKVRQGYVVWIPFSKPITEWMSEHRIHTLETSERVSALTVDDGTSSAMLLTKILEIEDIDSANLRLMKGELI